MVLSVECVTVPALCSATQRVLAYKQKNGKVYETTNKKVAFVTWSISLTRRRVHYPAKVKHNTRECDRPLFLTVL
jgi:hypothetical protein